MEIDVLYLLSRLDGCYDRGVSNLDRLFVSMERSHILITQLSKGMMRLNLPPIFAVPPVQLCDREVEIRILLIPVRQRAIL